MANFNPNHKKVLDDLLAEDPRVRPGKMFGFPAYYAGKKLCICLYEEGVGVKVPEATALRLVAADPNVIPFQPYGKAKMRSWVQINLADSADYLNYRPIFEEAILFVLSQQA
jgi:hypothetical protein